MIATNESRPLAGAAMTGAGAASLDQYSPQHSSSPLPRGRVQQWQRWTAENPCPRCGGWPDLNKGRGLRCHGFISADKRIAFCSREELAGGIARPDRTGALWPHALDRPCACGVEHGPASAVPVAASVSYGRSPAEAAFAIWRDAARTPSAAHVEYLAGRGLALDALPPSLRYVDALDYRDSTGEVVAQYPAVIAMVADPSSGLQQAIHRIYITPQGRERKALGSIGGGVVPLALAAAGTVIITEGIETALAAQQATGIGTWAALSAGGIRTLELPLHITTITIASDNDDHHVGQEAARAAAARWTAEGRTVRIAVAACGCCNDANDLLLTHGCEAVQSVIANAEIFVPERERAQVDTAPAWLGGEADRAGVARLLAEVDPRELPRAPKHFGTWSRAVSECRRNVLAFACEGHQFVPRGDDGQARRLSCGLPGGGCPMCGPARFSRDLFAATSIGVPERVAVVQLVARTPSDGLHDAGYLRRVSARLADWRKSTGIAGACTARTLRLTADRTALVAVVVAAVPVEELHLVSDSRAFDIEHVEGSASWEGFADLYLDAHAALLRSLTTGDELAVVLAELAGARRFSMTGAWFDRGDAGEVDTITGEVVQPERGRRKNAGGSARGKRPAVGHVTCPRHPHVTPTPCGPVPLMLVERAPDGVLEVRSRPPAGAAVGGM